MNPVLILTHNTKELTKKCVQSALSQDCGDILIDLLDNDSSDDTYVWAKESIPNPRILTHYKPQIGVTAGWNVELNNLFKNEEANHVLVINSDTVLPPWFYYALLSWNVDFVTGISVGTMDEIASYRMSNSLSYSPDFSAFLIRRSAWNSIGRFDESMVNYASDLDFHIRAWRKGIHLWNAGLPFYHERSSTMKNANPKERRELELQADADRMAFLDKYGFPTWSPQYAAQFSPNNFGIES